MRTRCPRRRTGVALVLAAAIVTAGASPVRAGDSVCPGDCNGDGVVTINELILAVDIALDLAPLSACPAADPGGDGRVTIDDLITDINSALNGCPPTPTPTPPNLLRIVGRCRVPGPGPRGLVACDSGTAIVVWRCNSNATCLAQMAARTRLGDVAVGSAGGFEVSVDADEANGAALLFESALPGAHVYRTMDIGGAAASQAARAGLRANGPRDLSDEEIDPASEAGVRLLDENGLQNFALAGIPAVIDAVLEANADTDFAGLGLEEAVAKALAVARADPTVQETIHAFLFTPTPTDTAIATATATSVSTATASATGSRTATASSTAVKTATTTATATGQATPSRTATSSATPSASPTATHSATATPSHTPTATAPASPTATASRTATGSVTVTPSRTGSATGTASRTATASATATGSAPSTPSRSATATATSSRTATATSTASFTRTASATRTRTPTVTSTRTATASKTRTPTNSPTQTKTVTATTTITPTKTITPTPTPFLVAQITTDRGCIETGNDPVYAVGENALVFFQVDGQPFVQAHVVIHDIVNGMQVGALDFGQQTTGVTHAFQAGISPPTGTETLALVADASPPALVAEAQCSFQVVNAPSCLTACDCAPGLACDGGTCVMAPDPVYCCTSGPCPMGAACQFPGGNISTCM